MTTPTGAPLGLREAEVSGRLGELTGRRYVRQCAASVAERDG